MFRKLPRYEDYQEGPEPRLPRVPTTWRWSRLASVGRQISETGRPELPLLSVYLDRGVIPYAEGGRRVHAPSEQLDAYQVVRPGDLVLNNQQAWRGSVGVSAHHGIISPAYVIWRNSSVITAEYGTHLFRAPVMVDQFVMASRGVGDIQRDLHNPSLRNLLVPVPPLEHQDAIARYLAHANARIDKVIAAKRRLVSLLEEQKDYFEKELIVESLSTSSGAVETGSQWIGEVPDHWVKFRMKQLLADVDERSSTGAEEVLSVSHLTGVTPRSSKEVSMFEAKSYVGHKICRPGDLVVNTMWAWMGALGVASQEGLVSPAYNVYRPTVPGLVDVRFLAHLLKTRPYNSMLRALSTGIRPSRLRFYPDQMLAVPLFLPPLEEQLAINRKIAEAVLEVNPMIGRVDREIELLQEFRTRLVADVVTGQLDVRTIASTLPAAPELFDNLGPELDDDLVEAMSKDEE